MNCIILGDKSDIAKGLKPMLEADGWLVYGWSRHNLLPSFFESWKHEDGTYERRCITWDLVVVAFGRVAPVGSWTTNYVDEWEENIDSNLIAPFERVQEIWSGHNQGASICFMAGSNPNKIMAGYSAYNASKMGLLKLCEQLDFETPDAKFFALGPGYVKTKIHKATLDANWPNERIERGDEGTPIEKIYDCLKWCISQPKEVVGGRNICASDPYGPELAVKLKANPAMYKLRRVE